MTDTTSAIEHAPACNRRAVLNSALLTAQYRQALKEAVGAGKALVVSFENSDDAHTIKHRVRHAAELLELDDVVILDRDEQIVAYREAHVSNHR